MNGSTAENGLCFPFLEVLVSYPTVVNFMFSAQASRGQSCLVSFRWMDIQLFFRRYRCGEVSLIYRFCISGTETPMDPIRSSQETKPFPAQSRLTLQYISHSTSYSRSLYNTEYPQFGRLHGKEARESAVLRRHPSCQHRPWAGWSRPNFRRTHVPGGVRSRWPPDRIWPW